jgi:hypothetical protein
MKGADPMLDATFEVAERISAILESQHVPAIVIGAIALAVHGYPRNTVDLDLAVAVPPGSLAGLTDELRREGWSVEVSLPDAQDPLGGVINIRAPGAYLVQVVNFDNSPANGFPRLVREAALTAHPLEPKGSLKVVDLPLLVAFKLYAGGNKSRSDICELLDRHPDQIDQVRECCKALGLGRKLDRILGDREPERGEPER